MLVYINDERKVMAYNTVLTKKEAEIHITENCIWVDEEIDVSKVKDGYLTVMFLNDDNTIRYDFELPEKEEKTPLEELGEQQLLLMTAQAEQYEEMQINRLQDLEIQATIYETILNLQEEIK